MYPDDKMFIIIGGVVAFALFCEAFEKEPQLINREHVHTDYSYLVNATTTSYAGAIVASAPSGSTIHI